MSATACAARIANVAGGRAEIGGRDEAIRTLAGSKSVNDLAGTMISLPMGGEVRLEISASSPTPIAERRTFARFNGEPVVAVGIQARQGRERRRRGRRGAEAHRRDEGEPVRTST